MAAKTYHLRLNDETVLSAFDYVEKYCPNSKAMSPTQVVAVALKYGMLGMRAADMLPVYDPDVIELHLIERIRKMAPAAPQPPAAIPLGVAPPAPEDIDTTTPELAISDEEVNAARAKIREQIEEHVAKVTTPDLGRAFEPDESDIPDAEFELDMAQVELAPMEFLTRVSEGLPDDVYLQRAISGDDPKYTLAVRIGYASLDPQYWGTKHAKSLVSRLYNQLTDEMVAEVDS